MACCRSIPQWGGYCSKDGRYGIYAPSRGGLDILDLRHGTVMRTLIPKIAEGIFNVICKFNETNEYVLYYHSGRKTLRVFRVSDGVMIANYRFESGFDFEEGHFSVTVPTFSRRKGNKTDVMESDSPLDMFNG